MAVAVSASGQIERTIEANRPVGPFANSKSQTVELAAGEILRLTCSTAGGAGFVVAPFVYRVDEPGKAELVATDDPDVTSAFFEWTANRDGRYYVLIRNVSPVAGTYQLTVLRGAKAGDAKLDPPLATVKIFYATNRQPAVDRKDSPYFTGEPQAPGSRSVGTCLVTIPRGHQMGEIEGPSIYRLEFSRDPSKHVFLKSVSIEMDRQRFYGEIAAKAAESPKREAFVFVHGFNVKFEDAVLRTAQMSYDLGFSGAPILYSWPSQGSLSPLAYTKDQNNADISAAELKAFLEELSSRTGVGTFHLIAHSMGNRVLTQALDLMTREPAKRVHFRQIALLAPDIDARLFRQLAKRIEGAADRITLYASSRDEALKVSEKLAGYPRAGDAAPSPVVIAGIDTIDASAVDTSLIGLLHQYYADNQTILSDLFQLLRDTPPQGRFGLTSVTIPEGSFWRFRPAAR